MIKVHHLNNSRSHRVLWLLEELALPYEIVPYQRDAVTNLAPPELKAIHPLGKSPVISDGDIVVAESGAIIDYIATGPGQGRLVPPAGTSAHRDYVHWLHFAEGSAMLPFMLLLYTMRLGEAAAPLQPRIDGEITNHLAYMDGALADRPFFCGADFSAADVQISFVLEIAKQFGRLAPYARLSDLLARYQARPAYLKAIERGGPYRFGP